MKGIKSLAATVLFVMATGFTFLLADRIGCQEREQKNFEVLKERVRQAEAEQMPPVFVNREMDQKRQILPKYQELYQENSNLTGWVSIAGTNIDYPVMQSEEREYYLHRDFAGNETFSGTPFVGYGTIEPQSSVLLVFGHNLKNGRMFHDLLNYKKSEYWESHPTIVFDTLYEHQEYEIFAAGYAVDQDPQQEGFQLSYISDGTIEAYHNYISELKEEALYDTGIIPDGEPLLLLVTCSYQTNDGRFFVAGKRKG